MRSNAKMVRWLCIITPEDRNSTGKPRNEMGMNLGNGYIIENLGGLVIQKEWKKVPGQVNVEISRLVVVQLESDLGKHGVLKETLKSRKAAKSQSIT